MKTVSEAPAVCPELAPVLDAALERLPEKYRAPLVLCYLQGKTSEEAARELGWPVGSMSRRLARARDLLRAQLAGRGVILSAVLLPAAVAEATATTMPGALMTSTLDAALLLAAGHATAGVVSAPVTALTEGMLRTMYLSKLKLVAAIVIVLGLGGPAAALFLIRNPSPGPVAQAAEAPAPDSPQAKEIPRGEREKTLENPMPVQYLALAANGRFLATAGGTLVQVWDLRAGKILRQFDAHPRGVSAVGLSADGKFLATGGEYTDNSIKLWNAVSGEQLHVLEGHSGGIVSLAFSPDSKTLASGSFKSGNVFLWDVATGKEQRQLQGKPTPPINVAMDGTPAAYAAATLSPDGRYLVSGHLYGLVRLWDTRSWEEVRWFRGKPSPVGIFTRAVMADNGTVASWDGDNLIRVWNGANGTELRQLKTAGRVQAVALSPDSRILASVSESNVISLWETATAQPRGRLEGHSSRVTSLAFLPHTRILLSGSLDRTARLWDLGKRLPAPVAGKPSAQDLETWWGDLASTEGDRANQALGGLVRAPNEAVPFFQKRIAPVPRAIPERITRLVADLDSDQFAVRERAATELEKLGEEAEVALRQRLAAKPSLDLTQRLEQLLTKVEQKQATLTPDWLRCLRVLEALEQMRTPEARGLLARLAGGGAGARLTREAQAALDRLAQAN